MPSAEWRRSWLYSSIQAATVVRASALVAKCSRRRSSNSTVECQDSITALSKADPGRPIDWRTPNRSQAARVRPAVYSLPWSVCRMTPAIASRPPPPAPPPSLAGAGPAAASTLAAGHQPLLGHDLRDRVLTDPPTRLPQIRGD